MKYDFNENKTKVIIELNFEEIKTLKNFCWHAEMRYKEKGDKNKREEAADYWLLLYEIQDILRNATENQNH